MPDEVAITCCQNMDVKTVQKCVLCQIQICKNCLMVVENQNVCIECMVKVMEEIESKNVDASPKVIPLAILGGLVGACLGAAIWFAFEVYLHIGSGIVAFLIGYLAGHGVSIAANKKKALFLQIISVIFALFGVYLGYFTTVAHLTIKHYSEQGIEISYFDVNFLFEIAKILPNSMSYFSLIFFGIAVIFSWKISAPLKNIPLQS